MTESDLLVADVLTWFSDNTVRIAISVAAAILIILALWGLKRILLRAAARLGGDLSWAALVGSVVRSTRTWFLIALAARLVLGYSNAPELIAQTIEFVFVVAATFQAALWARTFVLGLIEHRVNGSESDPNLTSALAIIRLLVTVAVFAIATIFVLDNLGVNVTGLVAGLGVGGIAIGLAAQGIFSDLFAALSILFDRPFQVGDAITYQGKEGPVTGTVEQIGLKSTRIRALTGELRIIANAQLLAQEVTNFTGREFYRMQINVGVTYQTPPAVAKAIPELMREIVERARLKFVRANFIAFGPSSLDYELLFEAEVDEIVKAKAAYQDVAIEILHAFNERGIDFAYPTQTTFTAAPDGSMVLPYPANAMSIVAPAADGSEPDR